MIYPKQINQKNYMGKKCTFTGEYYRHYKTKKVIANNWTTKGTEKIPVEWKIGNHKEKEGWIVGFGFCFNGEIISEYRDYTYFASSKRVNYVRVRVTPSSPEIKVPCSKINIKK